MGQDSKIADNGTSQISLKDIYRKVASLAKSLGRDWKKIATCALIGGLLGLAYSVFKKPVFNATCTFVLDEGSKAGGLSQYAGLASLAGLDISGNSGSDMFKGDNILELYKSRLMIAKTLLSYGDFNGNKKLLIDRYIDFNNLRKRWREKDRIDTINFDRITGPLSRKQDSIISDITEVFNRKFLTVTKPDRKLNIYKVDLSSNDELFAQTFTLKLVDNVNNFYIQTKTKKTSQNVIILQRQADSIRKILNSSISGVASALDASPNANPFLTSLKVSSQKKQIDVQSSSAIYTEVVKNLEISKISLRQEMPLIQIIDAPILPLQVDKISKLKGFVIGFVFFAFLSAVVLMVKKLISPYLL